MNSSKSKSKYYSFDDINKTIIKYFITVQQKKHETFYTQSQETVLREIRKSME